MVCEREPVVVLIGANRGRRCVAWVGHHHVILSGALEEVAVLLAHLVVIVQMLM